MYIGNNWMTEPEVNSYIRSLIKERDMYKQDLIDMLRKASTCVMGEKANCPECPHYFDNNQYCPTQLTSYAAKLRLEQLLEVYNIC